MVDRRPMLARRLASAAMRIVYTDTSHTLSHLATSNVPELINVTLCGQSALIAGPILDRSVSQIPTHELVSSWCPDCYKIATDAEPRTVEIRYTGPAPLASLVAQSLAADGLDVDWRRPEERRDLESMAAEVAVTLTATGTTAAVRAAIAEARKRLSGRGRIVAPEQGDETADCDTGH
jgi:thiol-disulfide isomerase/thioredoxin